MYHARVVVVVVFLGAERTPGAIFRRAPAPSNVSNIVRPRPSSDVSVAALNVLSRKRIPVFRRYVVRAGRDRGGTPLDNSGIVVRMSPSATKRNHRRNEIPWVIYRGSERFFERLFDGTVAETREFGLGPRQRTTKIIYTPRPITTEQPYIFILIYGSRRNGRKLRGRFFRPVH